MKKVTVFWPPESLKKSRFNLHLIISFAILLFAFISCNNLINSDDNSYSQNPSGTEEYINFTGRCSLDGAYPRQLASASTQNTGMEGRSALPQIDSSYEYFVEASSADGKTSTGGVNPNLTFSIPLAINHTWTIRAGIRKTGSTDKIVFSAESDPVTPDRTATSFENLNLILKPCQSGSGSVSLAMTVPAAVKKIETECSDTNWKDNDNIEAGLGTSGAYIRSKSDGSDVKTVKSGIYNIIIKFFDENDFILYSIPQTVNIIDDMETNLWRSGGSSDSPITEDGHFTLQSDHISKYTSTIIYVGPNSAANSANDSNEGRAYSPLESVNEAIKRIRNANVSRDYKIFVSGSISENIKIGGEGADVLPGTAASSITIQGLNNNAADVLKSPQLSTAPCLSIQTDIPVILKNIKITTNQSTFAGTYSSSAQGGGLYIKTGADAPGVTLDSGAWIDNCIISGTGAKGAGIYLDSGKLTIKTGAKISNNHFPTSNGFGGGIYIKSGAELILSGSFDIPYGGSVTQNDIYVEAAESIKIKNAISPLAGTSGAMATITPAQDLQRGVSIVSLASGSSLSSIAPYKDYFALSNNDWLLKANSAGKALVLDAPIYVAGSADTLQVCTVAGSDTGNGTKSAPFATIEQAVNAIAALNAAEDYTIYVDGKITGQQTIPASFTSGKASSLTIQGASGNTNDILDGNSEGSVLTISSPVPVTIKDLKITGGNTTGNGGGINMMSGSNVTLESGALIGGTSGSTAASVTYNSNKAAKGGGIYSEGNLTLKNGSSVTYNYAVGLGGGIYCDGGSLSIYDCAAISLNGAGTSGGVYTTNDVTISGPVIIAGNVNYTGNPSNLYLEGQKKVILMGSLTNGEENAQIGISKSAQLNPGDYIVFTSNYGTFNSVAPGTYFTGDQWTVAAGSDGEAVLAVSGGNITIEPVYEDITVNVDKTSVLKSATEKKFTFTATGTDSEGNTSPITIGSGEGQLVLTIESVTYHGETVPASYYDTCTDYVTLGNSLPAGNYTINTSAVYQGSLSEARTYSASFEVKIKESNIENVSSTSQAVSSIAALTDNATICVTGEMTKSDVTSIVNALKNLSNSKPDIEVSIDLGNVTGVTELPNWSYSFCEISNLVEITLPEGITEIPGSTFRDCTKLRVINLPMSLERIGEQFGYLCRQLETVTLGGQSSTDNGTIKIENNVIYSSDGKELIVYGNKTDTSSFTVPSGVEKIVNCAFITTSLSNIILPDGLKVIDVYGIEDQNLTSIVLPASITEICYGAFDGCPLTTIKYKGSEEQKNLIEIEESYKETINNIPWVYNYTGD